MTTDDLEFCSAECLETHTPQADVDAADGRVLSEVVRKFRICVALVSLACVLLGLVLLAIGGLFLPQCGILGAILIGLSWIGLIVASPVYGAVFLAIFLVGQAVFVFYHYPLFSLQTGLSVLGFTVGVGLLRWAMPKLEDLMRPKS
ncbi:MAG: hypothetical protein ACYS9X_09720 [Planctomycetota bacterium]|jgi:hypothetical protein